MIRFRSSAFDPRAIVGGAQPMDAFTRRIDRGAALTGGPALPGPNTTRKPTARTDASLEEHQGRVLGVMGEETAPRGISAAASESFVTSDSRIELVF